MSLHAPLPPPPDSLSGAGPSALVTSHSLLQSRDSFSSAKLSVSPPSPPSSPPLSTKSSDNASTSSFRSRPLSVCTLSRPSLAEKVAELTSIPQPDRPSLATAISSFPTALAAADALVQSAGQIEKWVDRAGAVLRSLDADGDVSWATASGREGLEEVDGAISRFSGMMSLYVAAVEELQNRADIVALDPQYLTRLVEQVETVVSKWQDVKLTLVHVKAQVEIALEWEELWDSVIGDIALEITALRRLIFQMEERRHRSTLSALTDGGNSIDLGELETIVEEAPSRKLTTGLNKPDLNSIDSPLDQTHRSPVGAYSHPEDSNLLALFARMQPLRASLDFLPMRLSNFLVRGRQFFPTDCDDLESRRVQLEQDWRVLEGDAEALRRELGEDQWVLVFRNAGRQALKMCESVARSVSKLRDGLDNEIGHNTVSPPTLKMMESYEAKKVHYGSAIDRVLAIIDRGVKDRLTVNGEILRLQSEMRRRWTELQEEIKAVDFVLETLNLADSRLQAAAMAATPLSRLPMADGGAAGSNFNTPALSRPQLAGLSPNGIVSTPGSSPASSVVLPHHGTTASTKSRQSSFNSTVTGVSTSATTTTSSHSAHRRPSGMKLTTSRLHASTSSIGLNRKPSRLGPSSHSSDSKASTPTTPKSSSRPPWSTSTNTSDLVVGHTYNNSHVGSPSSPSTNAVNRKKSLASVRSAATAGAVAEPAKTAPPTTRRLVRPSPSIISPPSKGSTIPRPGGVSSLARPSTMNLASALAGSRTPRAQSSMATPAPTRTGPRSSVSALPTPTQTRPVSQAHSRAPSQTGSRSSSALGRRYGNHLQPQQSAPPRSRSSLPAPTAPSVSSSGSVTRPPSRSVSNGPNGRLSGRSSIGMAAPSPMPSRSRPPLSLSASTSAAMALRVPQASSLPSATKIPRRQSSAARLVTSPSPWPSAPGLSMASTGMSTPRLSMSSSRPTATPTASYPSRPPSAAGGPRSRASLLPQPTPSRTVSGPPSSSTPSGIPGSRLGRPSRQTPTCQTNLDFATPGGRTKWM